MMRVRGPAQKRRWWVPEIVQTSAMDCGPAALTCLLEGFYISASYGRLREACQTSVDGTSIDVIEEVARQLGLDAEQVMLPSDYLWIPEAQALPALVVVKQPNGLLHFVIVWRRVGRWLQIMDPGVGRRWTACDRFMQELHRHGIVVSASDWYEWATSDDTIAIFRSRLRRLGASVAEADDVLRRAKHKGTWHGMAGLDAALRMVERLAQAGGLRRGHETMCLLNSLFVSASQQLPDACLSVPATYWSVMPAKAQGEVTQLVLSGAVLLRIRGCLPGTKRSDVEDGLAPELSAALNERPVRPQRELWRLMRGEGILTPLALMGAVGLGVGAVLVESLLFRGMFDLATVLSLTSQRLFALGALVSFILVLWACELPIVSESLRLGRHLEVRLRSALLRKLPRLNDRYLQSRPISDMADRSHSLWLLRTLPDVAVRFIQTCWEVVFTIVGIGCIAPHSLPLALAIAAVSLALAAIAQHPMREGDMRVRGHAGALHGFYLDALRGIAPVRTHGGERAIRREHEGLLTEWARSSKRLLSMSLMVQGTQSFVSVGLVGVLIVQHLEAVGITGSLLLLVYWALKLPSLGKRVAALALQYPAQRNVVVRLLEPLNALSEPIGFPAYRPPGPLGQEEKEQRQTRLNSGVEIALQGVRVVAAGHTILREISLTIQPGEHLALVGPSGAGKSSLVGVLLGWHRPSEGVVLVDQQPLSERWLPELRRVTAWVDPAIQIWNRSFLENIHYGSRAGMNSALGSLLERADLTSVIARLPDGLQNRLGEGGTHLSGGEGQRLRLARAMSQQQVRLVLLDEPFRGLDREQRHRHLAQVRHVWESATLICVTHDVAETQTFKRVLVVENGCIVEDGCPRQLAAEPASRYRALLDAELSARQELWKGTMWRHFRLDHGQLEETGTRASTSMQRIRTNTVKSGMAAYE